RVNGCEAAFEHLLAVQKKIGFKEGEGLRGDLSATVVAMDPLIDELLREAIAHDDRAARTFNLMLLTGGVVSLLFGAAFAIAFARRLTRPIEELTRVMGEVVETGDLTRRVQVQSADEVGLLAVAFNRMAEEMNCSQESLVRTRAQRMDAVDSLDAGLGMYGSDERMVVCNAKYKESYAQVAPMMVPGTSHED